MIWTLRDMISKFEDLDMDFKSTGTGWDDILSQSSVNFTLLVELLWQGAKKLWQPNHMHRVLCDQQTARVLADFYSGSYCS